MADLPNQTYYEMLKISSDTPSEEIHAIRIAWNKRYHIDTGASRQAEERLARINAACDVLEDDEMRAAYDKALAQTAEAEAADRAWQEREEEVEENRKRRRREKEEEAQAGQAPGRYPEREAILRAEKSPDGDAQWDAILRARQEAERSRDAAYWAAKKKREQSQPPSPVAPAPAPADRQHSSSQRPPSRSNKALGDLVGSLLMVVGAIVFTGIPFLIMEGLGVQRELNQGHSTGADLVAMVCGVWGLVGIVATLWAIVVFLGSLGASLFRMDE